MFLTPLLLSALALASAPIIIHLLNRRRFIRVDWAPMRVLKQTMKSNRKRVRLEQWLLLALRTLAIVALVIAIARPITSGAHLQSLFSLEGRASRVVVVDNSLGMGTRIDSRTSFERAVEATGALLSEIGGDDEVTLAVTSNLARPIVRGARIDSPDRVIGELQQLGTTDVGNAWGQAFEQIDRILQEATYPVKEVTLVSDLGQNGWAEDITRIATRWANEEVKFRILDVGRDQPGGLQLTEFVARDPVVLVDTDTSLLANVTNTSGDLASGETMAVRVDGLERSVDLPDIKAGQTVTVPIPLTFGEAGPHRIDVELPGDALPADGRAFLTVDVRAELDVVLIDGEPGVEPFEGEVDFLALALAAGYSRVRVTTLLAADWEAAPLTTADLVVLANVDRLPDDRVRELEELVEAGTGLIIFAGTAVSPDLYNTQLFAGAAGLLPAKLGEPVEVEQEGLVLGDVADSPLAPLNKLNAAALTDVQPTMVLPTIVDAESETRVLAYWNDAESSAAILSKRLGAGTVLLVTVSADRDWSNWPTKPTYVLAMRSAAFAMAGRAGDDRNLVAGESIRIDLDAARLPERVAIVAPNDSTESDRTAIINATPTPNNGPIQDAPAVPTTDVTAAAANSDQPTATFANTQHAGYYLTKWSEPGGTELTREFAISPDVADASRDRLDQAELMRLLGPLDARIIPWAGTVDASAGASELWRWAICAMLLLLVAESVLGSWIDRGRRNSGSVPAATPKREVAA